MRNYVKLSKKAHRKSLILRWKSRLLFIFHIPLIFWAIFGSKRDKQEYVNAKNYEDFLLLSAEIKDIQSSIFSGVYHLNEFSKESEQYDVVDNTIILTEMTDLLTLLTNLKREALRERRKLC